MKSWKPTRIIATVRKLFSWCAHSWRRFAEGVLKVVLFTVLWFKWSLKKYCVAKVLLTIGKYFYMKRIISTIPTGLVTNSLLSSFCPFLQTKNKNQVQQVGGLVTINISLLFIASRVLLQSQAKFNRLL